MNHLPPDLPLEWHKLFRRCWRPGIGLDFDGIFALLQLVGMHAGRLAYFADVTELDVWHAILRWQPNADIEARIAACLSELGLTAAHIWGSAQAPTKPANKLVSSPVRKPVSPDSDKSTTTEMANIPRFEGRLVPARHGLGLVVDCETTGLSPEKNALVELGMILFVFSRPLGAEAPRMLGLLDTYTGLQDPGKAAIHPKAMEVNRLSLKDLAGRTLDHPRISQMVRRAEVVVAHNAAFDRPFVTRVVPALGLLPWVCSQRAVPWKLLGHPSAALAKLCTTAGIAPGGHRALSDCRALLQLLSVEIREGETVLSQLLDSLNDNGTGLMTT